MAGCQPPQPHQPLVIEELEELEESPCCSCSNTTSDTDSLTGWSIWDKFGEVWESEELPGLELQYRDNRRQRGRRETNTDLREIFWKICLENQTNTALEEMHNLPSWDSPDIFLDSEESAGDSRADREDSIEIFQSSWHIFTEPKEPKSWNDQQKFGVSWSDHVNYYQDSQTELPRTKKSWSPAQLLELVESLENVKALDLKVKVKEATPLVISSGGMSN